MSKRPFGRNAERAFGAPHDVSGAIDQKNLDMRFAVDVERRFERVFVNMEGQGALALGWIRDARPHAIFQP